jgi:hypothetical protein
MHNKGNNKIAFYNNNNSAEFISSRTPCLNLAGIPGKEEDPVLIKVQNCYRKFKKMDLAVNALC